MSLIVPSAASSVEVSVRSGSVNIRTGDVVGPTVTKGAATIDPDGFVRVGKSASVEITCPAGTDVVVATASGSVTCAGRLGSVRVATRSGDITVEHCTEADLRTSSGKVTVGVVEERCRIAGKSGRKQIGSAPILDLTTASGRVTCGGVRDAVVHGASGSVHLVCVTPGEVDVRTMSGRVTVECAGGWAPRTDVSTRGRLNDRLPAGDRQGTLRVSTLSGGIVLRPA